MYSWIFRHLPGPLWIRIIQTLLAIAFVVLVLMNFVFPWANQFSPWTESTIDAAALLGPDVSGPSAPEGAHA